MADGLVAAIFRCAAAGEAMESLTETTAAPGVGLAGDRYATGAGFYSARPRPDGGRELTLIEAETLAALQAETGIVLPAEETRRNLVTRGVRLHDLLGQHFTIGAVECEGIDDCPPCQHLVDLTAKPVLQPLVGRGGLRARIVRGGIIRVGDPIAPMQSQATG